MLDHKLFLKLLQLDLRSHPPSAPVKKVTLSAEPVRPRFAQGGLFLPTAPEPERLELTLARIAGVVGDGNVGSAELLDTHRPDAFRMVKFLVAPGLKPFFKKEAETQRPKPLGVPGVLALRLFRPPLPIRVDLRSGKPAHVRSDRINGEVVSAAGPWKASGEWWKEKTNRRDTENTEKNQSWIREEWDVAVASPLAKTDAIGLYRIFADEHGKWFAHGEYD